MHFTDTYQTLEKPSAVTLFKDKGSKFFGYAFPVNSEKEVKAILEKIKKEHVTACHFCYAWQIGVEQPYFRVNDDGEPSNTAGMPIYRQIKANKLTYVLVVSVRYFGGTKLGVGGLITAYKTSAKLTLESSKIVEKTIDIAFKLTFSYALMNKVQRIIKEKKATIVSSKMELDCTFIITVRKKNATQVFKEFKNLHPLKIEYERN